MSRVLVVDDQEAVRDTVRLVLEDAGHHLSEAASGPVALDLLGSGRFDVVVSDIAMPGMTGVELLQAVHERDPDLPVILMTGAPSLDSAVKAVEFGALRYLSKPFDPLELVGLVEEASRVHREARIRREVYDRDRARRESAELEEQDQALDRALAGLWLAYQPIVRWSARDVFGWEALLRTDEPSLKNPMHLVETAKGLGRLYEVGDAVRRRGAEIVDELPEGASLFINLDPDELDDPALYDPASPLARVAERVVVEITERASIDDDPERLGRIATLRSLGYRIAVDDLGAGYSALTSFAQLSPEVVKVDMSIVRDVHLEPTKARLIRSLASLCRDTGIDMIVEGIEQAPERNKVVELGCDLMQGYFFARPDRVLRRDMADVF